MAYPGSAHKVVTYPKRQYVEKDHIEAYKYQYAGQLDGTVTAGFAIGAQLCKGDGAPGIYHHYGQKQKGVS